MTTSEALAAEYQRCHLEAVNAKRRAKSAYNAWKRALLIDAGRSPDTPGAYISISGRLVVPEHGG